MKLATSLRLGTLAFPLVSLLAAAMPAQTARPESGTADLSVKTVSAVAFTPVASSTGWAETFASRHATTAGVHVFTADLDLPSGAVIESLELEGCDATATGRIDFTVQRLASPVVGIFTLASGSTGATNAEVPGCTYFFAGASTPATIDNFSGTYRLRVVLTTPADLPSVRFRGVRVFYRLQVSPAPATATFTDVPTTHPLFRFVEAISRSGITAGCGGGQFCPNQPLTRGQMAVFLSVALGLHFPF